MFNLIEDSINEFKIKLLDNLEEKSCRPKK